MPLLFFRGYGFAGGGATRAPMIEEWALLKGLTKGCDNSKGKHGSS